METSAFEMSLIPPNFRWTLLYMHLNEARNETLLINGSAKQEELRTKRAETEKYWIIENI